MSELTGPGQRLQKGDRVLVSLNSKPVIAVVVSPDGPLFARDAQDQGKLEFYIGAAADVLVKIELSDALEAVRRTL